MSKSVWVETTPKKTRAKKVKPIVKEEGEPYTFAELSDSAKQQALSDNYDLNVDHDWWQWTYEDAAEIGLRITGFDVGRGRDIEGEFTDCGGYTAQQILIEHGESCD